MKKGVIRLFLRRVAACTGSARCGCVIEVRDGWAASYCPSQGRERRWTQWGDWPVRGVFFHSPLREWDDVAALPIFARHLEPID